MKLEAFSSNLLYTEMKERNPNIPDCMLTLIEKSEAEKSDRGTKFIRNLCNEFYDTDMMQILISNSVLPLIRLFTEFPAFNWEICEKMQQANVSPIEALKAFRLVPELVNVDTDFKSLKTLASIACIKKLPYYSEEIVQKLNGMPYGLMSLILLINETGVSLERLLRHRDEWKNLLFWTQSLQLMGVIFDGEDINYKPKDKVTLRVDYFKMYSWLTCPFDNETLNVDQCLLSLANDARSLATRKWIDLGHIFDVTSFLHVYLVNGYKLTVPSLFINDYYKYLRDIIADTSPETDLCFTFDNGKAITTLVMSKHVKMLPQINDTMAFENYNDFVALLCKMEDTKFVQYASLLISECKRLGCTDLFLAHYSLLLQQKGCNQDVLKAFVRQNPTLIYTYLPAIFESVKSGSKDWVDILNLDQAYSIIVKLQRYIKPQVGFLGTLLLEWAHSKQFSVDPELLLGDINQKITCIIKDSSIVFDILDRLMNPAKLEADTRLINLRYLKVTREQDNIIFEQKY